MPETSPRPDARLNPAYVLSAICMIFGLFALNGSLDFSPLPAHNLLLLIGVLNAYEALTLLLAFLLHRRGITIDARTLLIIEALFLFDGAFLTSELITVMPSVGVPIAIALLLAAVLKTWAVLHVAGEHLIGRIGALSMLMLVLLLVLPWVLQTNADGHSGKLQNHAYFAGWWIVSLAPLTAAMLWRREDRAIVHAIVAVGMISLLAHIGTAAWVHKIDFTLAYLAPAVLATTVLVGHGRLFPMMRPAMVRFELLVPVLAVVMSAKATDILDTHWLGVDITPLRLALVAAAMVYVHGWLRHRDWAFAVALVGGSLTAIAGATTHVIGLTVGEMLRAVARFIHTLIPRTLAHWGWLSVASAFVFMIGGAVLSIRRASAGRDSVSKVE